MIDQYRLGAKGSKRGRDSGRAAKSRSSTRRSSRTSLLGTACTKAVDTKRNRAAFLKTNAPDGMFDSYYSCFEALSRLSGCHCFASCCICKVAEINETAACCMGCWNRTSPAQCSTAFRASSCGQLGLS